MDDWDIKTLASVYGTKFRVLRPINEELQNKVGESADKIEKEIGYSPRGEQKTIIFIGDSITSDRLSYAKMTGALLKKHSAGRIIDAGISGDTTSDIINRFYDSVLNLTFDSAVIMIGTNDARGHHDHSGITNTSPGEFKRNLSYLLTFLQKKKIPTFTITIPPVDNTRLNTFFGDESNYYYEEGTIAEINKIIRDLSGKFKTVCIDFAAYIAESGNDVLDEDGIHLSREGHESLLRLLIPQVC